MNENPSPQTIFHEALEISGLAERAAYLERACGKDANLLQEVDSLLAAHDAADSFLEPLVTPEPGPPLPDLVKLQALFPELEILGLIGRGGMGAVYQVRQPALDRFAALKILPPDLGAHPGFSERFHREARTMAALNHPNIVTIHEFGERDAMFFFLMEFVDGGDLGHIIHAGTLAPREALAIVPQICDALQYAHDHGVVHRDIKPGNILLDQQGRVKVADFGIAKMLGGPKDPGVPHDYIVGTPDYMAPEQRVGSGEVDHRADIYSLGAVFYELLAGRPPAAGHMEPPSKRVRIDVRLDEVVLRAMQSEPERRYQQVSEFREDVERVVGPRRRRAGPVIVAVTAMIAAVALGVTWMMRRQPPPEDPDPFPPVWENSIGMEFRPVPGTDTRMSIWETRNSDWDAFEHSGENAGRHVSPGAGPDHPVTPGDREHAEAFCRWLTRRERAAGVIRKNEIYRLPTDREWSLAVGLDESADAMTIERDLRDREHYPWGIQAPAPSDAGNYADSALRERMSGRLTISDYHDGFATTAPVGNFPANGHGFHDLGGNVWEWVIVPGEEGNTWLRGGSWAAGSNDGSWNCLLSSFRANPSEITVMTPEKGFRVVLAATDPAATPTLLGASLDGDLEGARKLIANGASLADRDAKGRTALHLAAREGHAELVAVLLEAGADVESVDRGGDTPLHAAAASGSLDTVRALVESGAKVRRGALLGSEPLADAAKCGALEVVKFLHQHGANIHHRDNFGSTPLSRAVGSNSIELVEWLLENGAETATTGRFLKNTPLSTASSGGNLELVTLLLRHGAKVDSGAPDGITPLAFAVRAGHCEIVELLLDHGAKPNGPAILCCLTGDPRKADRWLKIMIEASFLPPPPPGAKARTTRLLHARGFDLEQQDEKGTTPLLHAAYGGNTEVFQALVELGADVNATDKAGFGALHSAAEQGAERIVEILLAQGADKEAVTKDGYRPLHIAAAAGQAKALGRLIEAGADLEAKNERWQATPLHDAALHGRPAAVECLVKAKADVHARCGRGESVLMAAAGGSRAMAGSDDENTAELLERFSSGLMKLPEIGSAEDYTACVRLLLNAGANPGAIDVTNGSTALHIAALHDQAASLRLLLDVSLLINSPNHSGETALHAAARGDAVESATLLIRRGASLAPVPGAQTPLHAAAERGSEKVALLLLDAGAQPNACDGLGATPLHRAVNGNNPRMVRLLARKGSDLAARDFNYATPLHCAVMQDDPELIDVLCEVGADPALRNIEGCSSIDVAKYHQKTRALAALLEPGVQNSAPVTTDPE